MQFKVGIVTQYYEKIGTAIVNLTNTLSVGDKISIFENGNELFSQIVDFIQLGHEKVSSATKGQIVGIKIDEEVHAGAEVFKA